jgi:hypothetical protein
VDGDQPLGRVTACILQVLENGQTSTAV